MTVIAVLLKHKKEAIMFLLFVLCMFFMMLSIVYIYKYENSDLSCKLDIVNVEEKQKEAKEKADEQAYDSGEKYEVNKQKLEVKQIETRTQVEKIIERPVYINVCLDDDGLSEINSSIEAYNP